MLWAKKHNLWHFGAKSPHKGTGTQTQLSSAFKAKGRLASPDLIISGDFEGELISSDLLTTTESSVINGRVVVNDAVIGGRIYGEIQAKGQLTLLSSAIVEGSIACNALRIDLGASFEGVCFTSDPKVRPLDHT